MKSSHPDQIPTHGLESAADPIVVREIGHRNAYDFTQQHRHSYFELMLFQQGGGTNFIDFVAHEVRSDACYLIYPGQIHLLKRSPASHGQLIQFQLTAIESPRLQRLLQEKAWSGFGAVLFEDAPAALEASLQLVALIERYTHRSSILEQESQRHLLQALLFELFSRTDAQRPLAAIDADFHNFLKLIDQHFKESQHVGYYLDRLAISEKRLASLSQKYRGLSPLQIIHHRILLEARRLLGFGEIAHKEIAYDLGFDSPASFSAFVKKKTGFSPSEIQAQVTEIHNR